MEGGEGGTYQLFFKKRSESVGCHNGVNLTRKSYKLRTLAYPIAERGYSKTHALLKVNQPRPHTVSHTNDRHLLTTWILVSESLGNNLIHSHSVPC